MSILFEKVSAYKDDDSIVLPQRATAGAAGYDFMVAKDTIIPSYASLMKKIQEYTRVNKTYTLDEMAEITKLAKAKPTLVPTGIKCKMPKDKYLELSVRSSCPLKYWLILGNSVGVIDADYYQNSTNEGEIFFQLINLSPVDILLKKGDIIGQGIIKSYYTTDDDISTGKRTGGFGSTSNG